MNKQRYYKPNHSFYLILLALACCIVAFSFAFSAENKWFTVISGLGCGAFASVIVAWLIESSICRAKESKNKILLEGALEGLRYGVLNALMEILTIVANNDATFDINKKYCFDEIVAMLENADGELADWEQVYHNLGVALYNIDAGSVLIYEPTSKHMKIYSIIHNMQQSRAQTDYILNNCTVENSVGNSLKYNIIKDELSIQIPEVIRISGIEKQFFEVELAEPLKNVIVGNRQK